MAGRQEPAGGRGRADRTEDDGHEHGQASEARRERAGRTSGRGRARMGRQAAAGGADEEADDGNGHGQAGEARRGQADRGRRAEGTGRPSKQGGGRRARTSGQNNKRGGASRAMDMASITAGKMAVRRPIKAPRPRAQRKIGGAKTTTTPSTQQQKGSKEKQRKTKRACND